VSHRTWLLALVDNSQISSVTCRLTDSQHPWVSQNELLAHSNFYQWLSPAIPDLSFQSVKFCCFIPNKSQIQPVISSAAGHTTPLAWTATPNWYLCQYNVSA
jgi:hypothetical protein